jgi:hypothetical protein
VIAVERDERLHTLYELVTLAQVENSARQRGDHTAAREAGKRMREVVAVLGFDPLRYEPGRDNAERLISRRTLRLLRRMPGTTAELAKAAGIQSNSVRAYLLWHLNAGDVRCSRTGKGVWWELAE